MRVAGGSLGVGKYSKAGGDGAEVEYFDSVGATGRRLLTAPAEDLRGISLSLQRRCYWQDKEVWRIGRIVWRDGELYGVRQPDTETDYRKHSSELYVRWDRPIVDPIDVLVAHGNESPWFYNCREPFVRSMTEQRAASRGMHGILSSVVEIYEHQVEVATRVLRDTRQRYLLADEVGLGKTIEAGFVIRQYLLDHPTGHVIVLTPPLLRRQWISELRLKFLIDDFPNAFISVLSHDDSDSWRKDSTRPDGVTQPRENAGLLIVDEVHHLAALSGGDGDATAAYTRLARLASAVPRVLLLSATPLLHNEQTFHAMLHLLDPDVYKLDDIEGFRTRIRNRQALGNAFFTFKPDIPPFLVREKVATLRAMFPEDQELQTLLDAVARIDADPAATRHAITAARVHISEAYRIHRRLLRTRRSDATAEQFPVKGRRRPTVLTAARPGDALQDWLNDWRYYVRSTIDDHESPTRASMRGALAVLAERATHAPLLTAAARFRLEPTAANARLAELSGAETTALAGWPVDETEVEILRHGTELKADDESPVAVADFIRTSRRKTVLFASFTGTAVFFRDALISLLGADAVASHLATAPPAVVDEELDRFKSSPDTLVLVCDRSAEEGRNLQFAGHAIHLDLPWSPNRLEQRIGRLDRYGRGAPIPAHVFSAASGTTAKAWRHCLANGFGIFDDSVASLQYAIEALMPELLDALLDDGPDGLTAISETLPQRLATERAAVAEQDALDTIEFVDSSTDAASAIEELEDLWFPMQRAAEDLLCDRPGNLRFHKAVDKDDDKFRAYQLVPDKKTPSLNTMPLVAWDVLGDRFKPVAGRLGTYFRRAAVNRPGSRVFRMGEPLVDALDDYVRWDDRGQTFVFWRRTERVVEETLFLRFDYVVDADVGRALPVVEAADPQSDQRALQRRVDAYLAPRIDSLWTSWHGEEMLDENTLAVLRPSYDPRRGDTNDNAERRWALDQLIPPRDWAAQCMHSRKASEDVLRRRSSFEAACAAAVDRFTAASHTQRTQREFRLATLPESQQLGEAADLDISLRVDEALAEGIRNPRVRLDSVGVVILVPRLPDGPGFPRPRR